MCTTSLKLAPAASCVGLILEISGHLQLGIIQTAQSFLRTDTGLLDDATPDFDFRPEKCADTLGRVGPALVAERRQASLNARISERSNGIGVHFRDDLGRGLGRHKEAVP